MSIRPWPWPEDTREDKAKRVQGWYRDVLERVARGQCDNPAGELYILDERCKELGVYWAVPSRDPYDADEWVNAADAAHYADVLPGTIRKWAERGQIRVDHMHDGTPVYNIGDLRAREVSRRSGRAPSHRNRTR
ncbi:hypothetical protein OS122_02615 [Mycolicibacterium mucogenicum]|uniref:hypothetical protein n=1 Tax=Mycolicibacterium mucogenicum TaxID=56689 RepID=UPI00226A4CBC|nr:hypothetical protein [Mycolicibacterium mucogenicum]MCX8559792.1 hypothetical protein [Mycolicibacterium mucogenicum]